jgi:hypothetical protein
MPRSTTFSCPMPSGAKSTPRQTFPQLRAALDWSFTANGDAAVGIRLAGASSPLWVASGLFTEGARRVEMALAHVQAHTHAADQALLWRQLGRLVDETPVRARPAFERAVELYRLIGDPVGLAYTLIQLGRVLARLGKSAAGEAVLDEANSLLGQIELPWLRGLYLFNRRSSKTCVGISPSLARTTSNRRNCFAKPATSTVRSPHRGISGTSAGLSAIPMPQSSRLSDRWRRSAPRR